MAAVTCLTLTLVTLVTLVTGSAVQFSVGDVNVDMQAYGTMALTRLNGTDIREDLEYSRIVVKATEISVLNSAGQIASHVFQKTRSQEFTIDTWEGKQYGGLGATGRRISARSLGDLTGHIDLDLSVFTAKGELQGQKVNVEDAVIAVKIYNVTKCTSCSDATLVEMKMQITGKSGLETGISRDRKGNNEFTDISIPAGASIIVSNMVSKAFLYFSSNFQICTTRAKTIHQLSDYRGQLTATDTAFETSLC